MDKMDAPVQVDVNEITDITALKSAYFTRFDDIH